MAPAEKPKSDSTDKSFVFSGSTMENLNLREDRQMIKLEPLRNASRDDD